MKAPERPRLYLGVPPGIATIAVLDALDGGDVAAVELTIEDDPGARDLIAAIQAHGVAAMLCGRLDFVAALGADGVYLPGADADVAEARRALGRDRSIGAFAADRHGAMTVGEAGADFVAFDDLDLVAWWAETMVLPCLARGGTLETVPDVVAAGADFIAVGRAVWDDPRGPAAAIAALNDAVDTAWASC